MQVERLRLAGFKSFVEPAELAIEPGLTGIVGPNGCGKSNLVEALRWVMGEASARRLRGGEMDDVIFAGSGAGPGGAGAGRPARNLAEVALTLDNSARTAPFAYNDSATIEVVRRISRGGGSSFRINGREARARDVQLLFADAATGPHSGALVGQGRIGALIAAKPGERRALLDDAAGTAGLHARRHEAELKLQAAEANLARLDDVMAGLAAQIEALKKQARQAARYRRLGDEIRRGEAQLLYNDWQEATAAADAVAAGLRAGERELAAATEAGLAAEREREAAETALPPLRLAQAEAAAAATRIAHARAQLEHELARVVAAGEDAARRRAQLVGDLEREGAHLADAEAALAALSEEGLALERGNAAAATAHADAAARVEAARADVAAAETGLLQMTEACAASEAQRAAIERQHRDLGERHRRLAARLIDGEKQREALQRAVLPPTALTAAAAAVSEAAAAVAGAGDAVAAAAERLRAAQQREGPVVDAAREAERLLASLRAEEAALTKLLPAPAVDSDAPSLLSTMRVPSGFEAATAALFDGELAAPLLSLEGAPSEREGWRKLPPLPVSAMPAGAHPVADEIGAPPALARRLAHAFWVESPEAGWRLQPQLAAGQCLVDRDGRLWRWDGFTRPVGGATADAERLRQQNRLTQLADEIAAAAAVASVAAQAASTARECRMAASVAERDAVAALRAAEDRLAAARSAEADLVRQGLAAETRLAAIGESIDLLAAEQAELASQAAAAERSLALLPDPALARTALEAARAQANAARRRESEACALVDRLAAENAARWRRLAAIEGDAASWQKRRAAAAAQQAVLAERQRALADEIDGLAERPAAIARESEALAGSAATAATEERAAGDALAAAETRLRLAAETSRAAGAAVAEARERRARLEAQREAAAEGLARLRAEIAERLGRSPEALAAEVGADGAVAVDRGALAARLDRLLRERDAMGPVNLLAEAEMTEAAARLDGLDRERADLTAAIARLRRGIAVLDREGRERLRAAFARLNGHFGELFTRLFGGGKAELAWVGPNGADDDPLQAGLDIMARPPGKRLQSLTLLSGGEQALTAIALIFAVFLTNPAPICVLDEVDAPLDDANVDGFCRLVADIADATGTRFLLITHHRVTMARMDRLFGVTMAERGVSQLVSVDLARAAELRQSA